MKIVWTDAAQRDLLDSCEFWKDTQSLQFAIQLTQEIREEVATLTKWPKHQGSYVKEFEERHLPRYRQLLAGQNRIIFERGGNEPDTSILCVAPAVILRPYCADDCSMFEFECRTISTVMLQAAFDKFYSGSVNY
ncbi:type II toxin-antitoxin system RelE/ParE family toxin [Janthinobacterium sp. Mn2066]|uniref:type II toxin-antitoxin system RelE/ParE family toxin n=1 Tax=Janthinobacterium sp. Mn2066 TaxID=3395264 RepID=UPI003BEDCBB7